MTDDFWNKEFVYGAITRDDLRGIDVPDEVILQISDEDMNAIARKVGELYSDFGFWEDFQTAVAVVLGETDDVGNSSTSAGRQEAE